METNEELIEKLKLLGFACKITYIYDTIPGDIWDIDETLFSMDLSNILKVCEMFPQWSRDELFTEVLETINKLV
jgi:hypothetical protein